MTADEKTISIGYIKSALRAAYENSVNVEKLLDYAGIPRQLLKEPHARVSSMQYSRLMLKMQEKLDDEFLLHGGVKRSKPGTFPLVCHAMISQPNLKKALLVGMYFYNRFVADLRFRLYEKDDKAIMTLEFEDQSVDIKHMTTETTLTIMHRVASWLIGQRIPLDEATFTYKSPAHIEEYRQLFYCPLLFDQKTNAIIFNSVYLRKPVGHDEASLSDFLREAPMRLLTIPEKDDSLTAQIRNLIGKDFSRDFPDIDSVAASLHTTQQTLRRRLKDEGTSYQEIKDNVRRDAAIHYLANPDLTINQISQMMGFSEPSTFHRAFKKWTGITPGAYRQGVNSH